jgi:hypothetical protein
LSGFFDLAGPTRLLSGPVHDSFRKSRSLLAVNFKKPYDGVPFSIPLRFRFALQNGSRR